MGIIVYHYILYQNLETNMQEESKMHFLLKNNLKEKTILHENKNIKSKEKDLKRLKGKK